MTTLRKIAALSGVSAQTVSRVLRGQDNHNPQTRDRVLRIAKELNYQPNLMGKVLLSGKSKTLALLTRGFGGRHNLPRLESTVDAARQAGYLLYVVTLRSPENIEDEIIASARDLTGRCVDGLIIYQGHHLSPPTLEFFKNYSSPVVFLDWAPANWPARITIDRARGINQLSQHLASLGHKRVGLVIGGGSANDEYNRSMGYHAAFEKHNLLLDPVPVVAQIGLSDSTSEAAGYENTLAYLKQGGKATALVCRNDDMAMGIMAACRQFGLSIPRDISVAGFNDTPGSAYSNPTLTSVRIPGIEVGHEAVSMLTGLISNPDAKPRHSHLATDLVVRQSTGPAPVRHTLR